MEREIKRRRLHLLAASAVVIATLAVLYFLGTALLTLGLSIVVAYVLLPVAKILELRLPWRRRRPDLARGIATGVIFLTLIGILAGTLALVVPPTVAQSRQFVEDFPGFLVSARTTTEHWITRYAEMIPIEIRDQIEETLAGAGGIVGNAAWKVVSQTIQVVSGSFSRVLGLATAPVLVFYLMKDSGIKRVPVLSFPEGNPRVPEGSDRNRRPLHRRIYLGADHPGTDRRDRSNCGTAPVGRPFSFVHGIVAGLTEMVPVIGPWVGGSVGVLVTLASAPDKVPWDDIALRGGGRFWRIPFWSRVYREITQASSCGHNARNRHCQ